VKRRLRRSTRHGAANSLRAAPPEDGTRLEELNQPPSSITAPGPARCSPFELLEGVATSALPAPRIACQLTPQRNCAQRWRPESHLCHGNPERGAGVRRPPCGDLLTPELTRSPKTQTPDSVLLADDHHRRCRRQRSNRSETESDRRRTPTHRPVDLRPKPKTSNLS
jgi:hypothetical protein